MSTGELELRPATSHDAGVVARIWHQGWQDAHQGNVPDELVAIRTKESFWQRARQQVDETIVATVDSAIAGFVMVIDDEVEQVYVAADHRGTGVAAALLTAAEERVTKNGHAKAWLAVVAGNARARKFYERHGWTDEGPFDHAAPSEAGPIAVPAQRYTKPVS